nr:hypothetical protein [Oscillospiraceae bacterium]
MEEEQNADLPRPRKKDVHSNFDFHLEYDPDPDVLYCPEEESEDAQPIPELRRTQTRKFPAQRPAKSQAQYFDDTSEDIYYHPELESESEYYKNQDNSGYGAYEAYDMPERQTYEGRASSRTVKNNNSKTRNPKNFSSGKAGSAANSRKSSAPKSRKKSRKKSHGGGILKRLLRKILVLAMILFGIYSAVALLLI